MPDSSKAYRIRALVKYISFIGLLVFVGSCSNTKYLADGEVLFNEVHVVLNSQENIKKEADLKKELELKTVPKLNKKFLNLTKSGLWLHNYLKDEEGLIDRKIFNKYGEEPVLLDSVDLDRSVARLENHLVSRGFFDHNISYEVSIEAKRARVDYTIDVDQRYYIKEVKLPEGDSEIEELVRDEWKAGSSQKKFKAFDEDQLIVEKKRVATVMRNKGFYDFRKDYITYRVDSFKNYHLLNLYVDVDSLAGEEPHHRYTLNEIFIVPDTEDLRGGNADTIQVDDYKYISANNQFRPRSLTRLVKLKKGLYYSEQDTRLTINQFLELGVFRYVDVKFKKLEGNKLNATVFLTPSSRKNISFEVEANTRTGDSYTSDNLGTAMKVSYRDKNVFGGGELMNVNLVGGLEFDFDKDTDLINTVDLTGQINFKFPNLLVPFRFDQSRSGNRPITNISLTSNYVDRREFYSILSNDLSFGYDWRPSRKFRWLWTPFKISNFNVLSSKQPFVDRLAMDPLLAISFEPQVVLSGALTFIYNETELRRPLDVLFLRLSGESAGLTTRLVDGIVSKGEDLEIFGNPYSQFFRFDGELVRYFQLNSRVVLVGRLSGGLGWAHGNSEVLPYNRLFFAGGSTSLRAYRIRGIGPGTFLGSAQDQDGFDRFGDMKLEANVELRFPLVSRIKMAGFIDAGNVWNVDRGSDATSLNGLFKWSNAIDELALGGGLGLRFDFDYFILRLDTAIPFRNVLDNTGFQWVFDRIDPGDKEWRQDNIRVNFGIGYPF